MKVLVANLGSTSFKYRLFDINGNTQLAHGGIERIGSPESKCIVEIGAKRQEKMLRVPDHAEAVRQCLAQLTDPDGRMPAGGLGGIGHRLQGGARGPIKRSKAGYGRCACGHGGSQRRGPGP